jgi:hypothetical protein
MIIRESINDILKPKNLVGKLFYMSGFTDKPEFIFEIIEFTHSKDKWIEEEGEDIQIEGKVIYNNRMIDGPDFLYLKKGETFKIDGSNLTHYRFKELDRKPIDKIEGEIWQLNEFKEYLESLLKR